MAQALGYPWPRNYIGFVISRLWWVGGHRLSAETAVLRAGTRLRLVHGVHHPPRLLNSRNAIGNHTWQSLNRIFFVSGGSGRSEWRQGGRAGFGSHARVPRRWIIARHPGPYHGYDPRCVSLTATHNLRITSATFMYGVSIAHIFGLGGGQDGLGVGADRYHGREDHIEPKSKSQKSRNSPQQ